MIAQNDLDCWKTGAAGSNFARGMDHVRFFFFSFGMLYASYIKVFQTSDPFQEVLLNVLKTQIFLLVHFTN
jgi:hypothetical protein